MIERRRKRRLLIIDDDKDLAQMHEIVLESAGYYVTTVGSAKQAFEHLEGKDLPDLILLDYHLDEMDGHTFLDALIERNPKIAKKIPIVFLTARDDIPHHANASGKIKKTGDIELLLTNLNQYVRPSL